MPVAASAVRDTAENGQKEFDFSIPTMTDSDWIVTTTIPNCRVMIVADGVIQIQMRNGPTGAALARPPAVTAYWLEPTATEWGVMRDLVPPEFRLYNATAGALNATVILIPGTEAAIPAASSPR